MDIESFKQLIKKIVLESNRLKNKHTSEKEVPVNYACIFCQSAEEYDNLKMLAEQIGKIVEETSTGPLFQIQPLETVAGKLKLLKIRKPDVTRPEMGDADFTVSNYNKFKKESLARDGFKLIVREDFEMIELKDSLFNVLAYFSNSPLDGQLGV